MSEPTTVPEPCAACRAYLDRVLALQERWLTARFEGSDHIRDALLKALEQRMLDRFQAEEASMELTRADNQRHFESLNQFAERMEKLEGTFVTRPELIAIVGLAIAGAAILVPIVQAIYHKGIGIGGP